MIGYDYLVAVLMNVGSTKPEFYTFPRAWVEANYKRESWGPKLRLSRRRLDAYGAYRDEKGFELIAKALRIPRPRA